MLVAFSSWPMRSSCLLRFEIAQARAAAATSGMSVATARSYGWR